MSQKGLQVLAKDNLKYMNWLKISLKTCTHYLAKNKHRALFHYKNPHRRPYVLDLVHYYVYGPLTIDTHVS